MVMNCVNLHSMKQAKWLSSPRWMGRRSCKVRTHECRTEAGKKAGGEEMREKKRGLFCFTGAALCVCFQTCWFDVTSF